jgi:hypothetical protein
MTLYLDVDDADPRVFVTDPDDPESGRVFVWALTRWYERELGQRGNVAFAPFADSEQDLYDRAHLSPGDLTEISNDFCATVRQEFKDQAILCPEAPELSEQPLRGTETVDDRKEEDAA